MAYKLQFPIKIVYESPYALPPGFIVNAEEEDDKLAGKQIVGEYVWKLDTHFIRLDPTMVFYEQIKTYFHELAHAMQYETTRDFDTQYALNPRCFEHMAENAANMVFQNYQSYLESSNHCVIRQK